MVFRNMRAAQSKTCRSLAYLGGLLLLIAASHVAAQQWDAENPHMYPGTWYRITLGQDGEFLAGDGHGYGAGWHYYPQTGWYRQWFYNQPYNPDRMGYLEYEVYIKAVDQTKPTYVEVRFNWATPQWSQRGLKRPPLPPDAPTADEEAACMAGRHLYLVDNWRIGTIEPIAYHVIREYNPEWVSIDIRGRNAHIFRGAKHRCIVDEDAIRGACCDPFTGGCTLTTEAGCRSPLEWLGVGTLCDACNPWTGGVDFGDAHDSYKTLAAGNGARHTRVAGIHLGRTIDTETEAVPDPEAMGDDADGIDDEDGVVFSLPLISGERTPIEVTASTSGYLNAWLDANQDGDFGDPGEQIFSDELLMPGANTLSFRVPPTALAGTTFARFRFNTRGLLDWYGPATDGEVEDYQVSVVQPLEPQPGSGKGALKWSQPPQRSDPATPFLFSGWGEPSNLHVHQITADDWPCEDERPATGFQWWGSFQGWTQSVLPTVVPLAFHVAVWTDNSPEGDRQTGLGCPDTLVWETYCTNWTWNIAGYHCDPRESGDETCFQFTCLLSQNQWFHPAAAHDKNDVPLPAVYWLSIAALYDTPATKGQGSAPVQHAWGWTTRRQSFGSGAMRISTIDASGTNGTTWPPSPGSHWLCGERVEYPKATAWDLAFELLTNQDSPAADPDLAPVYRFWSESLATHFYTIRETEKDLLIREYPHVWTYDGIAFYAYPPDRAPVGAKPVYRFWSDSLGRHLYTTREDEKQALIEKYAAVWVFEGIAWYTLD